MSTHASPLDVLIPPEIKDDPFYAALVRIASDPGIKTILEIGASSGGGSTEALTAGMAQNPSRPMLYSIEVSIPRFGALRQRYEANAQVKPYNVSSVPPERFPTEAQVSAFHRQVRTALNQYPLEQVLSWLRADLDYIRSSGVPQDGIELIQRENGIDKFDAVLIDGSEFSGPAEFDLVYGARWILLDDVNSLKNLQNYQRLLGDGSYLLREVNFNVRHGYAVFERVIFDGAASIAMENAPRMMLLRRLGPGGIAIDVGANVGDFAIVLSRLVGPQGKVYSLEPTSSTFATLSRRLKEHGCDNVQPFQAAANCEDGQVQFNEFDDKYAVWNSIGMPTMRRPENLSEMVTPIRSEMVQSIRLDTFCREHDIARVDFLKIDVEGAEADVLKGAKELLSGAGRVRLIQFEVSQEMLAGMKRTAREVFDLLQSYGYECRRIRDDGSLGEVVTDSQSYYENYAAVARLPVHFFTTVFNAGPFIRRHMEQFEKLSFQWHWHVMEGAVNQPGLSTDGTAQYLDELAKSHSGRISVYRRSDGGAWGGRVEMFNVPLRFMGDECLLWEIDADASWNPGQIEAGRKLFLDQPTKTAAMYRQGAGAVVKTWRFRPGMIWANQEPPVLAEQVGQNQWRNVAAVNPIAPDQTEAAGLTIEQSSSR